MVVSSRAVAAMGLGLVGLGLPGRPVARPAAGTDAGVRKAAAAASSRSGPGARRAVPPVIGTVDIDAVFKGYDKVKAQQRGVQGRRDGQAERADEAPDRGPGGGARCSRS